MTTCPVRRLFQAGGDVHSVAGDETLTEPGVAGDHGPGVDADAQLELEPSSSASAGLMRSSA